VQPPRPQRRDESGGCDDGADVAKQAGQGRSRKTHQISVSLLAEQGRERVGIVVGWSRSVLPRVRIFVTEEETRRIVAVLQANVTQIRARSGDRHGIAVESKVGRCRSAMLP